MGPCVRNDNASESLSGRTAIGEAQTRRVDLVIGHYNRRIALLHRNGCGLLRWHISGWWFSSEAEVRDVRCEHGEMGGSFEGVRGRRVSAQCWRGTPQKVCRLNPGLHR